MGKTIRWSAFVLLIGCIVSGRAAAQGAAVATPSQPAQPAIQQGSASLTFVRAFSSANDVGRSHPVFDRALDILAGPKDDNGEDVLHSASALATDSNHRVFVADPDFNNVHIFDFTHAKYYLLEKGYYRAIAPVSMAVDAHDNLYVLDAASKTILVFDSGRKFRGYLGRLGGGETYFDLPVAIAIDRTTGRLYISDKNRHMIIIMNDRGRVIGKIGKRGGGERPGEFRRPSQLAVSGGEVFVLDAGNMRIQIFDTAGNFRRAIGLAFADARTGLAVDDQGNIYLSDPASNQIQVIRHDGKPFYTLDTTTIKGADFGHPAAMWVDAGYCLYAVDSDKNRVGLFQISGQNKRQCQ